MSEDEIDELIRDVASKHGIALGRNDPLMILPTILRRVVNDSAATHSELLEEHKKELEMVSLRWGSDAKEKAERILTAALAAAKDAMNTAMQDGAKAAAKALSEELGESRADMRRDLMATRRLAIACMGSAGLTSVVVVLSLVVWLLWR